MLIGNLSSSRVSVAVRSKRELGLVALIAASRFQQKRPPPTLKKMHPAPRRAGAGNETGKKRTALWSRTESVMIISRRDLPKSREVVLSETGFLAT